MTDRPNIMVIYKHEGDILHLRDALRPHAWFVPEGSSTMGKRVASVLVTPDINTESNWFQTAVLTRIWNPECMGRGWSAWECVSVLSPRTVPTLGM